MKRRTFFQKSLAASAMAAIPVFPDRKVKPKAPIKITGVEIWELSGTIQTTEKAWQWQSNPIHVYPEQRPRLTT